MTKFLVWLCVCLPALIKQQQAAGHPVASAIARVKLETNRISLRLASASLLGREDTEATEIVDVDIGLSAHRNASLYFSKKKETHAKFVLQHRVTCVQCWNILYGQ